MFDVASEYKTLVEIAERSSGGHFGNPDTVSVVVHGNRVLSSHVLPGVSLEAQETEDGIKAFITLDEGVRLVKPVHICFGHLGAKGRQTIDTVIRMKRNSSAIFLAHCVFPNAEEFLHQMEGEIYLEEGASLTYNEVHVHGPEGKIVVRPKTNVVLEDKALYRGDFTLVEGRVGDLSIDIYVDARGVGSSVEITSKVYGKYDDRCLVQDVVKLSGRGSSALVKARVVLKDRSVGTFYGTIEGAAPGAKGHVDCTEIVQGEAVAEASPVVRASHSEAEITHEAAIGRIADDKIAGLMAKGLSEDQAVDFIVAGLLR
ncbi:ABC-type transport system involved in Fe-S cluster assembly, permease component [Thermanaerovibrio velox DSM 12556]|uniref:ABC-type transport system involved in Fe-S cluster assembly, permease component n=1 Tax=Thermanaerovibrio velox DSM 12556 TaxID=926567 RepID=H0UQZ4_9BACT|nr:SufD family Fe-S cluster assembly protein [Thermanaerovibrio velox]EHM09823.1 ABC-type transport system involved in Fe-S cluster assembly, permease component [Thermanaerovibrio velox DSM 12556]